MEKSLYPLKFNPIFKEKIWGGQKIKTILNKNFGSLCNCGESWELSGIEGDISEVSEGFLEENNLNDLIEIFMYDLVGDKVYEKYGLGFPLLIKFIDADDDLSVQVHPDDSLAMKRYNMNGKTELWYILDSNPGSGLYIGFKKGVTKNDYLKAVSDGTIDKILEFYPAKRGDFFFIPGGTVHAIGKGILLAEIQESSDITYRIYDWNRTDEHGNSRELHCDDALDAIHFEDKIEYKINFEEKFNSTTKILRNEYFNINLLSFDKPLQKVFVNIDSFVIYVVVEGEIHFMYDNSLTEAKKGELILKPASMEELNLIPAVDSKVLEIYID